MIELPVKLVQYSSHSTNVKENIYIYIYFLWSSMEFSRTSSSYMHLLLSSSFRMFQDYVTLELIRWRRMLCYVIVLSCTEPFILYNLAVVQKKRKRCSLRRNETQFNLWAKATTKVFVSWSETFYILCKLCLLMTWRIYNMYFFLFFFCVVN